MFSNQEDFITPSELLKKSMVSSSRPSSPILCLLFHAFCRSLIILPKKDDILQATSKVPSPYPRVCTDGHSFARTVTYSEFLGFMGYQFLLGMGFCSGASGA